MNYLFAIPAATLLVAIAISMRGIFQFRRPKPMLEQIEDVLNGTRQDQGVHHSYIPFRVMVKFSLYTLGVLLAIGFVILCAAKAVPQ